MSNPLCRLTVTALTLCSLTTALACVGGDAPVKELSTGMTRDSVLKILASGAPADDSLPNVYRVERYLIKGQDVEIFFHSKDGKKEGRDTVPEKTLTPIVLKQGVVIGWGWPYFDSVAVANNILVRPRP